MSVEREKRSGRTVGVKDGSAGVALAVLLALVLGALVGAWFWLRAPAPARDRAEPLPAAARSAPAPAPLEPNPGRTDAAAPSAPARPVEDPDRFRGRGRIRGELALDGVEMPERWTLVLEPHPTLVGAESAARRRVEYVHGERSFEAGDLPLGGYRVYAEIAGLNSTSASVPLVRGSSDVYVTLRIARAGIVDGFVFDDAGAPAEGLVVTIESVRTRARTSAEVDATGAFVLRDVVDGDYHIDFGPVERPLVPRGQFTFKAPTLRWRETRLLPTGSARIAVVDARGIRIQDAEVQGSGSPQGVVRGRTGGDGELRARWLWPARYEIRATAPDGRAGRASAEIRAGANADVAITVE